LKKTLSYWEDCVAGNSAEKGIVGKVTHGVEEARKGTTCRRPKYRGSCEKTLSTRGQKKKKKKKKKNPPPWLQTAAKTRQNKKKPTVGGPGGVAKEGGTSSEKESLKSEKGSVVNGLRNYLWKKGGADPPFLR